MGRKRYKDQILLQILEACAECGTSKTQIVYRSGLNFLTILPYRELLSRCGLVVRIEGEIPLYRITDKGEEALGHLRRLEEMMEEHWIVPENMQEK